jgi:hypothetical protein
MAIGKSHAKVYVEKETKVTFDDVAGVDEAKEELAEIGAEGQSGQWPMSSGSESRIFRTYRIEFRRKRSATW